MRRIWLALLLTGCVSRTATVLDTDPPTVDARYFCGIESTDAKPVLAILSSQGLDWLAIDGRNVGSVNMPASGGPTLQVRDGFLLAIAPVGQPHSSMVTTLFDSPAHVRWQDTSAVSAWLGGAGNTSLFTSMANVFVAADGTRTVARGVEFNSAPDRDGWVLVTMASGEWAWWRTTYLRPLHHAPRPNTLPYVDQDPSAVRFLSSNEAGQTILVSESPDGSQQTTMLSPIDCGSGPECPVSATRNGWFTAGSPDKELYRAKLPNRIDALGAALPAGTVVDTWQLGSDDALYRSERQADRAAVYRLDFAGQKTQIGLAVDQLYALMFDEYNGSFQLRGYNMDGLGDKDRFQLVRPSAQIDFVYDAVDGWDFLSTAQSCARRVRRTAPTTATVDVLDLASGQIRSYGSYTVAADGDIATAMAVAWLP